jgi:hypothetical protein
MYVMTHISAADLPSSGQKNGKNDVIFIPQAGHGRMKMTPLFS